jgi:hypothetical protein
MEKRRTDRSEVANCAVAGPGECIGGRDIMLTSPTYKVQSGPSRDRWLGSRQYRRRGANVARKVFYSFHYDNDCWRTQQIRNIGFIDGSRPVTANAWEAVKRGGDSAVEKWIADQLVGRSCTVVLVGADTANRKWVLHEIVESWNAKKGIVGIRVNRLKDSSGHQSSAGANPFDSVTVGGKPLSSVVKLYSPTSQISTEAYAAITNGISNWIEEAIEIRDNYTSR